MMRNKMNIGGISFLIGLVLAGIIAIFSSRAVPTWAVLVIAVLGVIVGLLNIQDQEITLFLIAAITFLISFEALSSVFTVIALGWGAIPTFFGLMNVFVAPAAAVVAVKALVTVAKT